METTEIEGEHVIPRDNKNIYNELQQVISGVGRQGANNSIKKHSTLRYARRVIVRVNKEEENAEGHKIKTRTGKIKVSGLSHKRSKQCDPRLAREMFRNIYHIYSDIKNKEKKMWLCF